MCTMTWWRDKKGYEVFFNRDELKTRSRARPPEEMLAKNGTRFLAPTDPDAGGTWMLVNEHGITLCLLNRWHENPPQQREIQSRGLLVLDLADATSAQEVIDRLHGTDCTVFRPFTLVALDNEHELAAAWDGSSLSAIPAKAPITSSSYRFPEVCAARAEKFVSMLERNSESLVSYHAGEENASAFTVRMNRPDAQTWSRSRLTVNAHRIRWHYLEEMPDLIGKPLEHTRALPR